MTFAAASRTEARTLGLTVYVVSVLLNASADGAETRTFVPKERVVLLCLSERQAGQQQAHCA